MDYKKIKREVDEWFNKNSFNYVIRREEEDKVIYNFNIENYEGVIELKRNGKILFRFEKYNINLEKMIKEKKQLKEFLNDLKSFIILWEI